MNDIAIKIQNLKKEYKLGTIGGKTLNAEIQSWWARKRGKDDPNIKIGQSANDINKPFLALDGINLEIKKGEAVGIIGANGAGKSTLLKILSRVTGPTDGDVWIDGRISSMLEVGTGFHGELTGRENIYMNGAILGMTKKEVDEKIESIIDFSECREFIDTPVKRYSSGMYVKLAFAVASHLDSEIMIMDEVLAVGDVAYQKKCLGKMGDEAKSGKTILYVSHNMSTIRELCTRCIVLDKGKVVFDGDCEKAIEVYLNSNDEISDSFIDNKKEDNTSRMAEIVNVRFCDRDKLSFLNNEIIPFNMDLKCQKEMKDLYVAVIVSDLNLVRIGLFDVAVEKVKEGSNDYKFEMMLDELPAGDYLFHFVLHSEDKGRNWYESYDETENRRFSITNEDTTLKWQKRWFGFVNFKNIKQIEK